MEITLRSLYLVAVLHVLAFGTILCKNDVERKKRELSRDGQSTDGFLAGENTPVWLAYRSDEDVDVYYNLMLEGIVKDAIGYWKGDDSNGLPKRVPRSVDESADIVSVKNHRNFDIETFLRSSMTNVSEKSVEKRETNEVYHPSVLIMIDHEFGTADDENGHLTPTYEKILYALAFWNGVDRQLRHIKSPHVRLRIVGIIIGSMTNNVTYSILQLISQKLFKIDGEMTESVYSVGPPCFEESKRTIAGLLLHDDLVLGGIQFAVEGIATILGAIGTEKCPLKDGYVLAKDFESYGRKWAPCTLQQISSTLERTGWCLRKAKKIYSPGKPVEAILPGKLIPAKEQCRGRDYTDPYVCWDKITCDKLYCANTNMPNSCEPAGPPPDGTTCNPGKMCLDGRCVGNTTALT